jgi:hypothetical protein
MPNGVRTRPRGNAPPSFEDVVSDGQDFSDDVGANPAFIDDDMLEEEGVEGEDDQIGEFQVFFLVRETMT